MGATVDGAGTYSAKRVRDESDESTEAKRLRAADIILLDILEDVDSADRSLVVPSVRDLDTVLKSLEEEIAELSPNLSQRQQQADEAAAQALVSTSAYDTDEHRQSDLDYLLEASDDDLGLPPTVQSSDEWEEGAGRGDLGEGSLQGSPVLGQIWGFDDEIPSYYDALAPFGQDYGAATGGGEETVFDGGLFGYSDTAVSVVPDSTGCSWQPDYLPAV